MTDTLYSERDLSTLSLMYSIGVDLGGSSTKIALVSTSGRILHHERGDAIPRQPLAELFEHLAGRVRQAAASQGLPYPAPAGVGVGIAGIVDPHAGWLKLAGALELSNCDLRGPAEAAFQCPVAVECDSNAGALADLYWGRARNAENLLYIPWGTGISAGLVVHRRLYHSVGHSMGEFGHTQVTGSSQRPCYCGCKGCLEVEAGGRAIEQQVSRELGRKMQLQEIARMAAGGDALCLSALETAARLVARGIAGIMVVLNPDCVVLGGGVSNCFALMRSAFEEELTCRAPSFVRQDVTFELSDFPDTAGVIGAAMLPRHEFEKEIRIYAD